MRFFSKPHGTGAPLNVYMFTPGNLVRHLATLCREPRYFRCRVGVALYQVRHPSDPWLTAHSIRLIESKLSRAMVGFEWGSGKSTIWFSSRLKHLTSVEHDPEWYEIISRRIRRQGILNIDYRLALTNRGSDEYVSQIQSVPDASLDLILVDGQHRDQCIAAAVPKLREGGYLVVDNSDADYDPSPCVGLQSIRTSNGVWETTIFVRPEGNPQLPSRVTGGAQPGAA